MLASLENFCILIFTLHFIETKNVYVSGMGPTNRCLTTNYRGFAKVRLANPVIISLEMCIVLYDIIYTFILYNNIIYYYMFNTTCKLHSLSRMYNCLIFQRKLSELYFESIWSQPFCVVWPCSLAEPMQTKWPTMYWMQHVMAKAVRLWLVGMEERILCYPFY